jgi:nucleotide-binding universal stress UspA family protein
MVEEDIVIGNVPFALMKQIDLTIPHVIVIGRNSEAPPRKDSVVSYITRNTKIPVLVVPGSHNPKRPNRAVLATDMRPINGGQLASLIDIVKGTSQELSILNIKAPYDRTEKDIQQWSELFQSTYGIKVNFLKQENGDIASGLMDFIRSNKVDLLCTVKHKAGFFDKLFGGGVSNQFTNQGEVPVLVLND